MKCTRAIGCFISELKLHHNRHESLSKTIQYLQVSQLPELGNYRLLAPIAIAFACQLFFKCSEG